MMENKKLKCEKCGHEWVRRKENPKACPKCKRYDFERMGKTKNA